MVREDSSVSVVYETSANIQNSRLSPEQRQAVHDIMVRHARNLQVQLEMLMPDKCDVILRRGSSRTGDSTVDIGWTRDE